MASSSQSLPTPLREFLLPLSSRAFSGRALAALALTFVAYLGTGQLAHYLFPPSISPAIIWPPAGIALAAMVLEGYAVWPAIVLASLANSFLNGSSPVVLSIVIAAANVAQAFLGTWLLRRFDFRASLARLSDAGALIFVAIATTLVVPLAHVVTLVATHAIVPGGVAVTALGDWWTGEILSIIVLAPLIVRWVAYPRVQRLRFEWLEIAGALAAVVIIDLVLFWTHFSQARGIPLVYALLLPLMWIALRLGPRMTTLALFLNAGIALSGTAIQYAAPAAALGERLFQTEIFIVMITLIFLILCAVAEDRKHYANDLARHVGRLEDALAQIKKDDDAKNRFIATLAHELRNPLAPLLSSLELLNADPQKSEGTRAAAGDMATHVRTMRHLLDDLLDISRISRGKLTLQKEHTDLHAVAERSVRIVDGIMQERKHELAVKLPDRAVLLEGDPVRLEQVIVNLLNNAAKYTPEGGRIELAVSALPGIARISVKDNGIGIDPALQHRIFEPFLQLEENLRKLSGLGIGLSLTKNLVDMHGGTIEVRSEGEGRGSEFVVELPTKNLAAPEAPPAPVESRAHSFRILVVDDNRAAADALGKLLRRAGHEVNVAYAGAPAIEAAAQLSPDIILLDIGMPEMDGHETARRLRAGDFGAVLIALTGYGQDSDRRKAQEAGFNHHLTKPVGLAELEEVFAEIPVVV